MKTVEITVTNVHSIEHALENAIEVAEGHCTESKGAWKRTHEVYKVTFKTVVAELSHRDKSISYHFEAELKEK